MIIKIIDFRSSFDFNDEYFAKAYIQTGNRYFIENDIFSKIDNIFSLCQYK